MMNFSELVFALPLVKGESRRGGGFLNSTTPSPPFKGGELTANFHSVKSKSICIAIALCVMFSLFSECKKYPDGPKISLRSRATRIAGTWYIDTYLLNGGDFTSAYLNLVGYDYALTISKNGTYQELGFFPDEGTCRFGDKYENFYMQSYAAGGQEQKYSILRLEFKSLWLRRIKTNGEEEEIHYVTFR